MQPFARSADEIAAHFEGWDLDAETVEYLRFHARRYSVLLRALDRCQPQFAADPSHVRLLDIGPGLFTQFLRDTRSDLVVDSLGFEDRRFAARARDAHIQVDLVECGDLDPDLDLEPYDVVIMAEVIEHLPICLDLTLRFVASLVRVGGVLVLQTPNACSLPKRLRMLRGHNPFEMIRESRSNPGHFREYTRRELASAAEPFGLQVLDECHANYFRRATLLSSLFRSVEGLVPRSWRDG